MFMSYLGWLNFLMSFVVEPLTDPCIQECNPTCSRTCFPRLSPAPPIPLQPFSFTLGDEYTWGPYDMCVRIETSSSDLR